MRIIKAIFCGISVLSFLLIYGLVGGIEHDDCSLLFGAEMIGLLFVSGFGAAYVAKNIGGVKNEMDR